MHRSFVLQYLVCFIRLFQHDDSASGLKVLIATLCAVERVSILTSQSLWFCGAHKLSQKSIKRVISFSNYDVISVELFELAVICKKKNPHYVLVLLNEVHQSAILTNEVNYHNHGGTMLFSAGKFRFQAFHEPPTSTAHPHFNGNAEPRGRRRRQAQRQLSFRILRSCPVVFHVELP